eukprot:TRINITY_DN22100_c0_g1_i1.p1 TRINITY_DN22100_c0_g1~~TRINITY_DN22100_c0_g1_i1.p1  ORF type:complete len:542 (-),score=97.49 TRINITY_DN22100_c0_g1_i1:61-1644(-)
MAFSSSMSRMTSMFGGTSKYQEQLVDDGAEDWGSSAPRVSNKPRSDESNPASTPWGRVEADTRTQGLMPSDAALARRMQEDEMQDPELQAAIRESLRETSAKAAGSQQRERSEKRRSRKRADGEGGSFGNGFDFPQDWVSPPTQAASTRGSPAPRYAEPSDVWPPVSSLSQTTSPAISAAAAWPSPQASPTHMQQPQASPSHKQQVQASAKPKERSVKPAPPAIVTSMPVPESGFLQVLQTDAPRTKTPTRAPQQQEPPAAGQFDEAILAALAALPQNSLVDVLRRLQKQRPEEVAMALGVSVPKGFPQTPTAADVVEPPEKDHGEHRASSDLTSPAAATNAGGGCAVATPIGAAAVVVEAALGQVVQAWPQPAISAPAENAASLPLLAKTDSPWPAQSPGGSPAASPPQPVAVPMPSSASDPNQARVAASQPWPGPAQEAAGSAQAPPPLPAPATPPVDAWPGDVASAVAAAADAAQVPSSPMAKSTPTSAPGWPSTDAWLAMSSTQFSGAWPPSQTSSGWPAGQA